MACPFFIPTDRSDAVAFPHPARLPLGSSWRGVCSAPGHEQATPNAIELEWCNLGYAKSCPRLPENRGCDAVRFAVVRDSGKRISLQFVLEKDYLPAGYGFLEYSRGLNTWTAPHPEQPIQKMAECFLQSYLDRSNR